MVSVGLELARVVGTVMSDYCLIKAGMSRHCSEAMLISISIPESTECSVTRPN